MCKCKDFCNELPFREMHIRGLIFQMYTHIMLLFCSLHPHAIQGLQFTMVLEKIQHGGFEFLVVAFNKCNVRRILNLFLKRGSKVKHILLTMNIFAIFDGFSEFCSTFGTLHFEKSSNTEKRFEKMKKNLSIIEKG